MWNDFKEFLKRGNVLDLAIGVIIGAASTAVVTSVVKNIISPFIGMLTGGYDFNSLVINLSGKDLTGLKPEELEKLAVIRYGALINDIITFLITAFVVFLIARYAVKLFKNMEAVAAPTPDQELLTEIRDILKTRGGNL